MIVSAPSYVIPGTYGENVRYLASRDEIQAVELLFYYFDRESRDLFIQEKKLIRSYRGRFSFSVHMPEVLVPDDEELIELTRDLADRYIIHPPATDIDEFRRLVESWRERYGEVFLIENLIEGEFHEIAAALESFPLCCDTGHLLRSGAGVSDFLERYSERLLEIHLHGVQDGSDHRSFAMEESWFQEIVCFLKAYSGVVNLEVFSVQELDRIVAVLREAGLL
jgi:sugar phosphate isomerase/epimerase